MDDLLPRLTPEVRAQLDAFSVRLYAVLGEFARAWTERMASLDPGVRGAAGQGARASRVAVQGCSAAEWAARVARGDVGVVGRVGRHVRGGAGATGVADAPQLVYRRDGVDTAAVAAALAKCCGSARVFDEARAEVGAQDVAFFQTQ